MTSKEFIIQQIKYMVQLFNQISVRYEYDSIDKLHKIEVLPLKITQLHEFREFEANLVYEFISRFCDESVCILSEDSLIEVENSEFECAGMFFGSDIETDFKETSSNTLPLNINNISTYKGYNTFIPVALNLNIKQREDQELSSETMAFAA